MKRKLSQNLNKLEKHYRGNFAKDLMMLYYIAIVVSILALISTSLILFPLLLVLYSFPLYIILIFLGIIFGLLFDILLHHLTGLNKEHHLNAGLFVFIAGFVLFFVMSFYSNKVIMDLNIPNYPHNPFFVSLAYSCSFLLPYVYSRIRKK